MTTGSWRLRAMRGALRHIMAGRDPQARGLVTMRDLVIDGRLDGRLYTPVSAPPPGPVLLYFHGGGFAFCDIDTHDALCARLAHAGALRVLSCAYRLAPEHAFPAALDDAVAAALWLAANTEALGGDPGRLAIGGDSAGGYLAEAAFGVWAPRPRLFAPALCSMQCCSRRGPRLDRSPGSPSAWPSASFPAAESAFRPCWRTPHRPTPQP